MEFSEVVQKRYSCKKFDASKNVEKEKLDAILNAGKAAPTAKNLQEQKIYVCQSKEVLEKIDSVTPCRYNANLVLCVAFNKNNVYTYPNSTRTSGIEDAAIVATHMILEACNQNVDSCWINNFDPQKLHDILSLPEDEEILMLLDLGYKQEGFKPLPNHTSRKDLSETVKYL